MINHLVFQFYRLLMMILLPIFNHAFIFYPEKIRRMILERKEKNYPVLVAPPVWIHASSGEIEYAKPVIRQIKVLYPEIPILLTYSSPSAKRLIGKDLPIAAAMALPWDLSRPMKFFLDKYKPKCLLIARTDVWPEMIYQCSRAKIPSLLFSTTLAPQFSRHLPFAKQLTQFKFNQVSKISLVSSQDELEFKKIGVKTEMVVDGDSRYDQVFYRQENQLAKLKTNLQPAGKEKTIILGSTWAEDDEVLFPCLPFLMQQGFQFIVAPHEVDEPRIQQIIAGLKLPSKRYSTVDQWNPKSEILIVDQIGCLFEIYNWGCASFVGGSFKAKVHSVMEPLSWGHLVSVGPKFRNNREAVEFSEIIMEQDLNLVSVLNDRLNFTEWVQKIQPHGLNLLASIHGLLKNRCGATNKTTKWVVANLK